MKNRSVAAQLFAGLLLTVVALTLAGCGQDLYRTPEFNFAGRPTPPSLLQQRVMASYSSGGNSGGLYILDGLRDLRGNIQNTIPTFPINGFSGGNPSVIINYPEQETGYVFSQTSGSFSVINYGKESATGGASFTPQTTSVAAANTGTRFVAAIENTGSLVITGSDGTYALNLPNIYKVALNSGNTVILAMVRNSDTLYRVIKLNATNTPIYPPGAVDCQPVLLPVYCVVPVPAPPSASYDRPSDVYFSPDGATAYVLNCGPECGGKTAGLVMLQEGALTINVIPTVSPLDPGAPSPASTLPPGIPNPIPIPGGVTAALSDGTTLYLAGQQLLSTGPFAGLFSGNLTTLNMATDKITGTYSISDGHHSKMLFADDNTLWIGSQQCANGVRAATATLELANATQQNPLTDEAANYNCLTRVQLGTATLQPHIVPAVYQLFPGYVPPPPPAVPVTATNVPFPNTNQNNVYYGDLTGLCWVQQYHKVFTAYGSQIHAFYTGGAITNTNDPANGTTPAAGSEIDNTNITIQGTVLDVAYIDALTNAAN